MGINKSQLSNWIHPNETQCEYVPATVRLGVRRGPAPRCCLKLRGLSPHRLYGSTSEDSLNSKSEKKHIYIYGDQESTQIHLQLQFLNDNLIIGSFLLQIQVDLVLKVNLVLQLGLLCEDLSEFLQGGGWV